MAGTYTSTRSNSSEALADLEFARAVHSSHGLAFKSFIFPRNARGHLDLLSRVGLRSFGSADVGWTTAVRHAGRQPARIANLIDQMLPIPPRLTTAKQRDRLVELERSMLLMGRNGARRMIPPGVTRAKFAVGLERACRTGRTLHLWFHPSNFYYRRDEQLATLAWMLERAANEAGRGRIEICTMGSHTVAPMSACAPEFQS